MQASNMTETLATSDRADVEAYARDGAMHLPGLLDVDTYFKPLWSQLRALIDMAREQAGLGPSGGEAFDSGLAELVRVDRRRAGFVYDASRKLPAFSAIATSPAIWSVVSTLMNTELPGWVAQGSGLRMDHPGDGEYLTPWHQDYPFNLNSLDGVTVWLPIIPVDDIIGSVRFCPGSHKLGLLPVRTQDPLNKKRNTAATTSINEVDRYVAQFDETSIDTTPGDVLVLNGLTLHRSQHNHSDRTRWSIQLRYLNFLDETGRRIGWRSGMITNADVSDVHPGAVIIDEPEEQAV